MDWKSYLFSFKGRVNRARYWLALPIIFALFLIVGMLSLAAEAGGIIVLLAASIFILVLCVVAIWISLAVCAKRLHDRGKSGWWLLLFSLLPSLLMSIGERGGDFGLIFLVLPGFIVSIWALVEFGCLRGTDGPNAYGPDPLAPRAMADDVRTEPA